MISKTSTRRKSRIDENFVIKQSIGVLGYRCNFHIKSSFLIFLRHIFSINLLDKIYLNLKIFVKTVLNNLKIPININKLRFHIHIVCIKNNFFLQFRIVVNIFIHFPNIAFSIGSFYHK